MKYAIDQRMKLVFLVVVITGTTTTTDAFSIPFLRTTAVTQLWANRIDSSEAVAAALEASKKFGPTSKEARIAWDEVEEMDSSDNSAAFRGGVEECDVDAQTEACRTYDEKMTLLHQLVKNDTSDNNNNESLERVKALAKEIRSIALSNPAVSESLPDSDAMKMALAEAKQMTERYGISSVEAKMAWETVEEVASDNYEEAIKGKMEDECLIEAIEACEAMEELQRALYLTNNPNSDRYQG